MTEITFTVKPQQSGEEISFTLPNDTKIAQLKSIIHEKTQIAVENIRLLFKGRILKDDQTLTEGKVDNGVTVILVNTSADAKKEAEPSPSTAVEAPKSTPAA